MKKITILLVVFTSILFFLTILNAQSNILKSIPSHASHLSPNQSPADKQYNSILMQKSNSFLSNGEYQLLETQGWGWQNDMWVYSRREKYHYNLLNLIDTIYYETRNNDNWEKQIRYIYEYNDEGKMLNYLNQYVNGSIWVNKEMMEYSYDENGNKTYAIFSYWNGTDWTPLFKNIWVYDESNNNVSFQYLHWGNEDWQNLYRVFITYNENNEAVESISDYWEDSVLVNRSKNIRTFDSKSRLSRNEGFTWDGSDWSNFSKTDFIYAANDSLNTMTHQKWEANQWVNELKNVKEWDGNNLTQFLEQLWENDVWENTYMRNWSYNSYNNAMEFVYKMWVVDKWVNMNRELYTWEKITSTSMPNYNHLKSYSLYQNYPNPFNPSTIIKYGLPNASQLKISIYNLLGEEIQILFDGMQEAGFHNLEFDASNLSSGIYLYRISASSLETRKEFQSVKKMVLIK